MWISKRTWLSKRKWVGCCSYIFGPNLFRVTSFLLGLTRVSEVHQRLTRAFVLWDMPSRLLRSAKVKIEEPLDSRAWRLWIALEMLLALVPRTLDNALTPDTSLETAASSNVVFLTNFSLEVGIFNASNSVL